MLSVIIVVVALVVGLRDDRQTNTLKIGAVLGLTGSHAYYSEEAIKGMTLAKEHIADKYKSNIDFIIEDSGGKADKAASAAIKLIDQDKVVSLITFSGASAALSVAPIANSKKVIQMELVCYAPACHTKDDFLFRVSGGSEVEPYFIAEELLSKNIKNVYLLSLKNDFGISSSKFFSERFLASGGSVTSDTFTQDQTDFRSHIAKIKSSEDTQYVVFIGFGEIKNFLKQAREMNMELPVFAAQTAENPEVLEVAGTDGVKNLQYSYPGKTNRKAYLDFKNKYISEYNKEPSYAAFKAYDAVMVLHKAIEKCPIVESTCIKKELESIQRYEGASNVISFDEYGDISGEVFHAKSYDVGQI